MGHLDKRMDPDKDSTSGQDGRVKGGTSGNVPESAEYERNKHSQENEKAAPDIARKDADKAPSDKTR